MGGACAASPNDVAPVRFCHTNDPRELAVQPHRFVLNGQDITVLAESDAELLYVLRNDLGLRGTRFGCGEGSCGACAVLVDGKDMQSCELTMSQIVGRRVTTVEGLLDEAGRPGRVQQALIQRRAGQCGYCLSGIVVRIAACLAAGADRAGIVQSLTRNLCRCGAHLRVLRAVDDLLAQEKP